MKFLAAVPYIPRHVVSGSADWPLIVGLIVVMAIALTAVLVYAHRSVKTMPSSEHEELESDRKAA
jgi:hypothetical protein